MKYRGSQCLGNCQGHKAGARYARSGGRTLTRSSPSFNKGMKIQQKTLKKQGKRTRMQVRKNSK